MENNENLTPEKAKAIYWGPDPLPEGAKCIGGYTDPITGRSGALIEFSNGIRVLGNTGVLRIIGRKDVKNLSNRQWSVHFPPRLHQQLIEERNEYKRLLKKSLYAFNVLRNRRISEALNDTTYALASEIGAAFKRFEEE